VVWASEQAKADAARRLAPPGGHAAVHRFRGARAGALGGTVFVPDIGREVEGTITQLDARTLVGEGCLLGRLGCREQRWHRVK
jgi:uncharacterized protein (DUF2147 family)